MLSALALGLATTWVSAVTASTGQATSATGQVTGRVRNVAVGAGGYVSGIFADPHEKGLFYIRTDMGGAYRWDAAAARWIPILEQQRESSDFGIESIAVDPSRARTVYIQTGKYLGDKARIIKSTDAGDTWTQLPVPPHLASSGNGPNRMVGERLQVDPNLSDRLVLASRSVGLWQSPDGGSHWTQLGLAPAKTDFPKGAEKLGLSFVTFDKTSGKAGTPTPILYVGVFDPASPTGGVWKSTDGGESWKLMQGGRTTPARAAVAADGTLFVTYLATKDREGGVFKAARDAETLVNVSPETGLGYCALALDPANPKVVYTSQAKGVFRLKTFASADGGATWHAVGAVHGIGNPATRDGSQWFGNISQLAVNPFNPKDVWMGDWLGVLRTADITDTAKPWDFLFAGHEEIVPLVLVCAPTGAPLLCGSADVNGHRFTDVTVPPVDQFKNPAFGSTTGLDFCEADPNVWARVYKSFVGATPGAYSTDNGVHWATFKSVPSGVEGGRIAVSASDPKRFVWSTEKSGVFYTADQGAHWTKAETAPLVCSWEFSQNAQALASDRVDGNTFYLLKDAAGKPTGHAEIWRSTNGGQTWAMSGSLPYSSHANIYQYKLITSPSAKGKLWISLGHERVCKSSDGGETFATVPGVGTAGMIAFGKAAAGRTEPAVFLYGSAGGKSGLFRSDDDGATWTTIDLSAPICDDPRVIGADRQTFGRAYIGTDGRGIYVIDSAPTPAAPAGAADLRTR